MRERKHKRKKGVVGKKAGEPPGRLEKFHESGLRNRVASRPGGATFLSCPNGLAARPTCGEHGKWKGERAKNLIEDGAFSE